MKALGFNVDGNVICCACAYTMIQLSEYPNLSLEVMTHSVVRADGKAICPLCKKTYGGPDAEESAKSLAELLEQR